MDITVAATEPTIIKTTVIDEGWLVHQVSWCEGKTFGDVALSYLAFVKCVSTPALDKTVVVVFDGYVSSSTKDHEHRRRSKICCPDLEITSRTVIQFKKAKLLSNSNNKSQLIDLLCDVFTSNAIQVRRSEDDADTLIVKTAIEYSEHGAVDVKADDTDVLMILLHHVQAMTSPIYLTSSERTFDIKSLSQKLSHEEKRYFLVSFCFSGCDTVSSISQFSDLEKLRYSSGCVQTRV